MPQNTDTCNAVMAVGSVLGILFAKIVLAMSLNYLSTHVLLFPILTKSLNLTVKLYASPVHSK